MVKFSKNRGGVMMKLEKRIKIVKSMLDDKYPALFNFEDPKPLAIGIFDELKRQIDESDHTMLALALRYYVARITYYASFFNHSCRYGLNGKVDLEYHDFKYAYHQVILWHTKNKVVFFRDHAVVKQIVQRLKEKKARKREKEKQRKIIADEKLRLESPIPIPIPIPTLSLKPTPALTLKPSQKTTCIIIKKKRILVK